MKLRRRIMVIAASCGIVIFSSSFANSKSSSVATVPLKPCYADITLAPFYCVTVGGAAMKQPVNVRFDTGGNSFIIPKDCLKPGSYQIVPGQPEAVIDPWGNPSQVVEGEVSLMSGDQVVATLKNFRFLAGTEYACDDPNAFSNFGAGFDFYTYFPPSLPPASHLKTQSNALLAKKSSEPLITPPERNGSKSQNSRLVADGGWDSCVGSFLTFYALENKFEGQPYGFKTQFDGSDFQLLIGSFPTGSGNGQSFQFTAQAPRQCGGVDNVIEYLGVTGRSWTGPSVGGFFLTMAGMPTLSAQVSAKKTVQYSEDGTRIMMVDSGGGMLIVSDDAQMSLAQKFVPSGNASSCSDKGIAWLADCFCLNSGLEINVSSASDSAITYSYTTTDVAKDLRTAAAICPLWKEGSADPYIAPNGFNTGLQLFQHMDVTFDFANGKVVMTPAR